MNKDREKKSGKKPLNREEEEKARKAAELCLCDDNEDEVTMSFVSQKLKDSCSD